MITVFGRRDPSIELDEFVVVSQASLVLFQATIDSSKGRGCGLGEVKRASSAV